MSTSHCFFPTERQVLSYVGAKLENKLLLSMLLPAGWFWLLSSWSTTAHTARGLSSVSAAIWEAWPPVPCLCRRAEEILTPMDFSFVDLAESMFCFSLPRQGPWISIFFHHSFLIFLNLYPLCLPLGNTFICYCSILLLSLLPISPLLRCSGGTAKLRGIGSNNAIFVFTLSAVQPGV